ncbi:MAG: hypothetical protein AAGA54_03975 [Myxococcota bacterium]
MTLRRSKSIFATAPFFGLATALAGTLAVGVVATPAEANAAEPAKAGQCKVHAVLASKEGDGTIPKNLEFMKEWLTDEPYDRYKSFHLLGSKKIAVELEKPANATFKTGHKMKLSLLGGDEKKLKLHLDLTHRDGEKNLVAMDYSIEDNGLFFVQGGKHKSGEVTGRIFWAIQCARR